MLTIFYFFDEALHTIIRSQMILPVKDTTFVFALPYALFSDTRKALKARRAHEL